VRRCGAPSFGPTRLSRRRNVVDVVRIGIAHHLGWAVAVTATSDHTVVDRRRIDLIEPGLPNAPIHHEGGAHLLHRRSTPLSDDALATLVDTVRTAVACAASTTFDTLAAAANEPVASISIRAWPTDFPNDITILRRVPYESRADSVMYCQVLADVARARGWNVHLFHAARVEADATRLLGERADDALRHAPRAALGPPWTKDHRIALAATVLASRRDPNLRRG
jgi:hypothetical protein